MRLVVPVVVAANAAVSRPRRDLRKQNHKRQSPDRGGSSQNALHLTVP